MFVLFNKEIKIQLSEIRGREGVEVREILQCREMCLKIKKINQEF